MFSGKFAHPRAYAGGNAGSPFLTIRPPGPPDTKPAYVKFSRPGSATGKRNTKLVWIKFVPVSVPSQPVLARCVTDANGNQILYVEPIPGG
jgi:hypothetical protein